MLHGSTDEKYVERLEELLSWRRMRKFFNIHEGYSYTEGFMQPSVHFNELKEKIRDAYVEIEQKYGKFLK